MLHRRGWMGLVLAVALGLTAGSAALGSGPGPVTEGWWVNPDGGSWKDGGNWFPPMWPDGAGHIAHVHSFLPAGFTVWLDGHITLGQLYLGPYVCLDAGTAGGGGPGDLTMDAGSPPPERAKIVWLESSTINAPVAFVSPLTLRNEYGWGDLSITNTVQGTGAVDLILSNGSPSAGIYLSKNCTAPAQVAITGGALHLQDAATLTTAGVTIKSGGALVAENADAATDNRVNTAVTLGGGAFWLGGSPESPVHEAITLLTFRCGSSLIGLAGDGSTGVTLDIQTAERDGCWATINVWGYRLGIDNHIYIADGVPDDDGIIAGCAASGEDFAAYTVADGVSAFTAYYTGALGSAKAWDNVKVTAYDDSTTTDVNINSLNLAGPHTVELNGNTLTIESGGVIVGMGMSPPTGGPAAGPAPVGDAYGGAVITNGTLTAGEGEDPDFYELIVHLPSHWVSLTLDAALCDNPDGTTGNHVALTVSGLQATVWGAHSAVYLRGNNTYSGPTVVSNAILSIDGPGRLGGSPALYLVGGILEATDTFDLADGSSIANVYVDGNAGFNVTGGNTLTVGVPIENLPAAPYSGVEIFEVSGGGTLSLTCANTFTGKIVVDDWAAVHGDGGYPTLAPLGAGVEFVTTLQVEQDANFGDPDNDVELLDGRLIVNGTFAFGPMRTLYPGGIIEVTDGHTFTLGTPGQLIDWASPIKRGPGALVVGQPNYGFRASSDYTGPFTVEEGTLALQHPQAIPDSDVELKGGILGLYADADTLFNLASVTTYNGATIHVDTLGGGVSGAPSGSPLGATTSGVTLSINQLALPEFGTLYVTGGNGCRLKVEQFEQSLMFMATFLNTVSADVILNGVDSGGGPPEGFSGYLVKMGPNALNIEGTGWAGAGLVVVEGTANLNVDTHGMFIQAYGPTARAYFHTDQHLSALEVKDGAVATVENSPSKVLRTSALSMPLDEVTGLPTGTIDLKTNNMVIDYAGGSTPMADVLKYVKAGLNLDGGGYWDGTGITSSAARDDGTRVTWLAVVDNNNIDFALDTLEGEDVSNGGSYGNVLVKYTYIGDNDLNGRVDWENDFLAFQNGVLFGIKNNNNWLYGDYNYNGVVDWENDFLAFQNGILFQGGPLAGGGNLGGVPEPATLTLLALGAAAALVRRRRVRD